MYAVPTSPTETPPRLTSSKLPRLLNTSLSTVQKWEIGQKKLTGTALKLLHLVQKRGLEVVA
jgi:putative transcriptional regulator